RKCVAIVSFPIRSKAGLAHSPVVEPSPVRVEFWALREGFSINTIIKRFAIPASVAEIGEPLVNISAAHRDQHPLSVAGIFGNDIYDCVDGICSPNRTARSSNDFDSLNILKQGILHVPINSGKKRRVNGSTVNKHEYRTGERTSEATHPH